MVQSKQHALKNEVTLDDEFQEKLDKIYGPSTCQVCDRQAKTYVACSALGAISFAYCDECLTQYAEPLDMWFFTLDISGGPDGVSDDYKEWAITYVDGQYIKWDEICQRWQQVYREEL